MLFGCGGAKLGVSAVPCRKFCEPKLYTSKKLLW